MGSMSTFFIPSGTRATFFRIYRRNPGAAAKQLAFIVDLTCQWYRRLDYFEKDADDTPSSCSGRCVDISVIKRITPQTGKVNGFVKLDGGPEYLAADAKGTLWAI